MASAFPVAGLAAAGGFVAAAACGYVRCRRRAAADEDDDEDMREGFARVANAAVPAATEPVTVEAAPPGYSPLADAVQQQQQQQKEGVPIAMAIEIASQMSADSLVDAARRMAQLPPPTIKLEQVQIAIAMYVRVQELNESGAKISSLVPQQLLRVFGSYMDWQLPLSGEGDIFCIQKGQATMLPLCSSDAAFEKLKMMSRTTLMARPVPGWDAFFLAAQSAAEGVEALVLDMGMQPKSVGIPVSYCHVWGASLRLEGHLTQYELLCEEKGGPQPLPPAFCHQLATHPALHVLEAANGCRCNEEGAIMILTAPDHLVWASNNKVGKPVAVGPRALLGFAADGHAVTVFKGGDLSAQGTGHFENVTIKQGDLARGMAPFIQAVEEEKGVPSLPVTSAEGAEDDGWGDVPSEPVPAPVPALASVPGTTQAAEEGTTQAAEEGTTQAGEEGTTQAAEEGTTQAAEEGTTQAAEEGTTQAAEGAPQPPTEHHPALPSSSSLD